MLTKSIQAARKFPTPHPFYNFSNGPSLKVLLPGTIRNGDF